MRQVTARRACEKAGGRTAVRRVRAAHSPTDVSSSGRMTWTLAGVPVLPSSSRVMRSGVGKATCLRHAERTASWAWARRGGVGRASGEAATGVTGDVTGCVGSSLGGGAGCWSGSAGVAGSGGVAGSDCVEVEVEEEGSCGEVAGPNAIHSRPAVRAANAASSSGVRRGARRRRLAASANRRGSRPARRRRSGCDR